MQNNPVHLLDLMVREAGFEQALDGDVHPWIRSPDTQGAGRSGGRSARRSRRRSSPPPWPRPCTPGRGPPAGGGGWLHPRTRRSPRSSPPGRRH
jgi:hypothetical protein